MFTFARRLCVFLLGAAGLFAQTTPVPPQQTFTSGMIGIAEGQTARLNVLNPGIAPPALGVVCLALLAFVDGQGTVLKSTSLSVTPGKSGAFDIRSDVDLALAVDERKEIRATITIPPILPPPGSTIAQPAPCTLIRTLEVFDTLSGKTQVVLGAMHAVPPAPVATSANP